MHPVGGRAPEHDPHPGELNQGAAYNHYAAQGRSPYDMEQLSRQPGGLAGAWQAETAERIQRLNDQQRRAETGEYGPSSTSYSAASVRQAPVGQARPVAPAAPYVPDNPYVPESMVSRGVVAVVVGVVALLIVGLFLVFSRDVTMTEMGIEDKTTVSYEFGHENAFPDHKVTFYLNTENKSDEERKVKISARNGPGTQNTYYTFKVQPHTTMKGKVRMPARTGLDDQNTAGPNVKVVEIDGHDVVS